MRRFPLQRKVRLAVMEVVDMRAHPLWISTATAAPRILTYYGHLSADGKHLTTLGALKTHKRSQQWLPKTFTC
jgi:hypothetical protein